MKVTFIYVLLAATGWVLGQTSYASSMVNGATGRSVLPAKVFSRVRPGTIVVLGESHGFAPHHENQVTALTELAKLNAHVSVGLEFLEARFQSFVDQFTGGNLAEDEFLKEVGWGSPPFDFYRRQTLFAGTHGGKTLALNASRLLARKISKSGLVSLSPEERAELSPAFAVGNPLYFERFEAEMTQGGHIPPEAVQRYFEAQSAWDDTMAFNACQFSQSHPDHVVAVIVGDFHVAYFGGTPDRLRAQGCKNVVVISQVNIYGLSQPDAAKLVLPDPHHGPRADFVWVESAEQGPSVKTMRQLFSDMAEIDLK